LAALPRRTRLLVLLLTAGLGALLFLWRLGSTGLVDETPPLFAASARGMVERGDWLIPHVNGLPRYDKPPLVYWLMAALYSLPGQSLWDPLGSWAAALPSALASIGVMLALADSLLRWPQPPLGAQLRTSQGPAPAAAVDPPEARPAISALAAALAFALCPLVTLWGRIPVSDALFTALIALTLLSCWRRYADLRQPWPLPWLLLGLAVLTKGPVAGVLLVLTLLLFAVLQRDAAGLWRRLRPLPGLLISAAVALPWYSLALLRDGRAYWDSFFGYHNLQRFTSVVNDHREPWWFFLVLLLGVALPVTPLLLLGLLRALAPLRLALPWRRHGTTVAADPGPVGDPQASLARFAAAWLLAVLLFFTLAATKLPSYWLPATPAVALLVALTAQVPWTPAAGSPDRAARRAWGITLALCAVLAVALALAPLWVPLIQDPEMPTLAGDLLASGILRWAAAFWGLATLLGWLLRNRAAPLRLLALQLPLVFYVLTALLPAWALGDQLRGLPVRRMAAAVQRSLAPGEAVAMVGVLKPSLHFYSRRVVIYEGIEPEGLVNLADRLRQEGRPGMHPAPVSQQPTALVVIDGRTARSPIWRGLKPAVLAQAGIYSLWRLDRALLEQRAAMLRAAGHPVTWTRPRPERY